MTKKELDSFIHNCEKKGWKVSELKPKKKEGDIKCQKNK